MKFENAINGKVSSEIDRKNNETKPNGLQWRIPNSNTSYSSGIKLETSKSKSTDTMDDHADLESIFSDDQPPSSDDSNEVINEESKRNRILHEDLKKVGLLDKNSHPTDYLESDAINQEALEGYSDTIERNPMLANALNPSTEDAYDITEDRDNLDREQQIASYQPTDNQQTVASDSDITDERDNVIREQLIGSYQPTVTADNQPTIASEDEDVADNRDWIVDELANAGTGSQIPDDDFVWSSRQSDNEDDTLISSLSRTGSPSPTMFSTQAVADDDGLSSQNNDNIMLMTPRAFMPTNPSSQYKGFGEPGDNFSEPDYLLPEFGTDSSGAFVNQNGASGNFGDLGDEIDFEVVNQVKKSNVPRPTKHVNGKEATKTSHNDLPKKHTISDSKKSNVTMDGSNRLLVSGMIVSSLSFRKQSTFISDLDA